MMVKMYNEIMGIKSMVGKVDAKLENVDSKVKKLYEESELWKSRLAGVEQDVADLKSSVEMTHSLVKDECENSTKAERDLH